MRHHQIAPSPVTSIAARHKTALAVIDGKPKTGETIKQQSSAYFAALGAHITLLRKRRGMTQAELARAIGVSQQAVFAYEIGERRTSVVILIKIARVFSIPLEELARLTVPAHGPKRRLSPRAQRNAERLQGLSKTQQRFVVRIIDLLEYGYAKWSSNQHSKKAA
jgi:transcriptional regulator with XRE-family HTH domain